MWRLQIVTPATDDSESIALSPDGRQLCFAATIDGPTQLWLRPLSSETAHPIPGTVNGRLPFWCAVLR